MPLLAISPLFYGGLAIGFLALAPFVFRSYSFKSFLLSFIGIALVILVVWQWSNISHLVSLVAPTSETAHAQPLSASHAVVKQTVQEHAVSASHAQKVAQAVKPRPQPHAQPESGIPIQWQLGVVAVILAISGYLILLTKFGRKQAVQHAARGTTVCGQCQRTTRQLHEYRYRYGDGILQRRLCPSCAQECHAQLVHE